MHNNKLTNIQLLYPLIILLYFTSCYRIEDCEKGYLNIAAVGFTKQESDTFILKRFKANSTFNQPIDTLLLSRNINSFYTDKGLDTSFIIPYESNLFRLSSGYDYEVIFPATNTHRQISNIIENKNTQKLSATSNYKRCYNDIISYRIDGFIESTFDIIIKK